MNNILAALLFSTAFIAPAYAEEKPSMADLMHSSPSLMTPEYVQEQESAVEKGDCVSAEHGMGDHSMMSMKDDECDNMHGKAGSHMWGINEDDCDMAYNRDGRGYGMGGKGKHGEFGKGGRGHGPMGDLGTEWLMDPNMRMLGALALNEEQQTKITRLADKLKHDNWATQGLINDETAKLRDLYEADKREPAVIGKEYQKIFDLKRKMIEAYLETQNRIEAELAPEQRAQMISARHNMHGHRMQ